MNKETQIEIKELSTLGIVLTSNGELKGNMAVDSVSKILGEIRYTDEYQIATFYSVENEILFAHYSLKCYLTFRNDRLCTFWFFPTKIYEKEIIAKNRKSESINLLNELVLKNGKKVKGRKYFRDFEHSLVNLEAVYDKKGKIVISFK